MWRYDEAKERNFIALSGIGFVYELNDDAFSFDDQAIRWTLKTAYMHLGDPGTNKSWRSVLLEQGTSAIFNCDFWWNLDYRAGMLFSSEKIDANFGSLDSALWNAATWNQFYWNSKQSEQVGNVQLSGNSTSISFAPLSKNKL